MKIAFIINSLGGGGAERVLSMIIRSLSEQNIMIEVLCLEKDSFYEFPEGVNVTYLSQLTTTDSSVRKMLLLPIWGWKLKQFVKNNNINIVQSHIFRSNYVNILAKIFGSQHRVQIVEVISIDYFKNSGLSGKVNLGLIKMLYRYTDLVICKSERMKHSLNNFLQMNLRTKTINNPYDISKIEQMAKEDIEDFEFSPDKKYLITVGRLSRQKNQKTLIKALSQLPENNELIILGKGEMLEELLEYTNTLHLKDRVHFLGNKKNPFKYIQKADLFVLSSTYEGFPNVMVEAMICEIPVISTDCISGPREILAPKSDITFQLKDEIELADYGILYPVDAPQQLVKAVTLLLDDKQLVLEYQHKAKERVRDFSLEKIVERYKEVLCVE